MTKIKNTKKGMAKKTLSMSLVVAMLATSNVPVWAAEFGDGTEAAVTSEAEAPVVESTDEFTDDAAATTEAPVVEDTTEAVATVASTVYDDTVLAKTVVGEWGKPISLDSKSIIYTDGEKPVEGTINAYWTYKGNQVGSSQTVTATNKEDLAGAIADINKKAPTPTKAECIEGGHFGLVVNIYVNGAINFSKTYDFGAAQAVDLTNTLKDNNAASKVEFASDDYNNKDQKPTPTLKSGNDYIYQVKRGDKDKLGINDFAWDYVRTDDTTGENDLKSADERVNDKNVTVEAKVTAPGYTGSFVVENAFDIWQKSIKDAYIRSELSITTNTTEYEYTGEAIKPSISDISFKDTETGDDLSGFVTAVNGTDKAVGTATAGVKLAKKSTTRNEVLDNYNDYDLYFGLTQNFQIVKRDLSKCTVELQGDFTKGEMDDMISKGKSFTFGTELKLYDANHKELSGLYGEIVNKISKENGIYYITVTPNTITKNIVSSLKQEAATPNSSLRKCKVYFEDAVTGTTAESREASREFSKVLKNGIEYTGEAYTVSKDDVYVRDYAYSDNRRLTSDLYDIECDQTTNVGDHWIRIIGKGDYAGSVLTLTYTVKPASYKVHTLNKKVVFNSAYTNAADYAKEIGLAVTAQNKAMTDNVITKKNEATTAKTFSLTSDDMTVTYKFKAFDKNNNGNYVHNTIEVTTTITNPNYLGGTKTFTEEVELVHPSIADATVEVLGDYTFTGKKIIPNVKVTAADGTVLKEGTDYRLDVKHGLHAGQAEVIVTAVRDCKTDTKTVYEKDTVNEGNFFTINPANINDVKVANKATYTGEEITFNAGTLKLVLGDEDVTSLFGTPLPKEYKDNVNAGTATVAINVKDEWKNDFTATTADAPFTISPVELTQAQVKAGVLTVYAENGHILNFTAFEGFQYDGTAKTFKDAKYENKTITLNGKSYTLVNGKDYTIEYADNTNPDKTGKDGKTSRIYVKLSSNFTTKQSKTGKYLDGTTFTTENGSVITDVLAKEDYRITKASLEKATVSVTNPVYDNGKKVTPTIKVTVDGKELVEGTDYELVYAKDETYDATTEDSKKVTVKGIGGYVASSKEVAWGIDAKDIASDSVTVSLDKTSYTVDEEPKVTVVDGKTLLTADTDYTVDYTNKANGTLTITGVGNYAGTKEVTFTVSEIKPEVGTAMISDVKVSGNTVTPILSGNVDGAVGYDYVLATEENTTDGRINISKNILSTHTNFYYVPEGTYYVYCHAWKRGEDGKKVFGEWSNIKEVKVEATTPSTPTITSVKVKGSTVTVTYTESENATGYDVVLGTSVKKVNGERRPVEYGKLVKKNVEEGTVEVTFTNVPSGTYYAGLHAYNRTSANASKVFSKWSNHKTVRVK